MTKQKTAMLEPRRRPLGKKLGYKEERELAAIPGKLEALEHEQADIAGKLADPVLYRDRAGEVKPLQARHAAIEAELAQLLVRWEELEAKSSG
jgi:ATP-binding cassette subfamily F protein uup